VKLVNLPRGVKIREPLFFLVGKTRYAVVGGRSIAVARHEGGRKWTIVGIDQSLTHPIAGSTVRPVAAVDLDGDGTPEIVLRRESAGSGSHLVLRLDARRAHWVTAATNVPRAEAVEAPARPLPSMQTSMGPMKKKLPRNAERLPGPKTETAQ